MATWRGLLVAYLLGGLTFVPLVVIGVLLYAHLTFPHREHVELEKDMGDDLVRPGDDLTALRAAQKGDKDEKEDKIRQHESDVAAGYFAVCREYTPMGINAKPIERSTPVGSTTVAAPSPSVYQTMYRSIFERKPVPSPLDHHSQRPKKAGNVFYVVLRHGHLMLFDDDEQLEVRHVISLAHHEVSIYSGGDPTPEGELFIKRNALCLTRRMGYKPTTPDSQSSKPFYLFCENCSAKEDFYFALMRNQEHTFGAHKDVPRPKQFEVKHIIALVQKLHSSEEYLQTRWLNAMIGRVFLGLYRTADVQNFIREKLTKKISRVKRPSFLTSVHIRKVDTGDAAPFFTNPRLRDLTVEGECVVEADVRYSGNFKLEVAATAQLEFGTRFKTGEVNLLLAVMCRKLEGHILFKIKPPPSNRLWFSFQEMPKIEMTVEPIVSSRQITWGIVLRQIENRIKEVIAETLVHPFWDDFPFFKTEHKKWRAGIWEGDDAVEPSLDLETNAAQYGNVDEVDQLEDNVEHPDFPTVSKSHSLPNMDQANPPTGLFGRKLAVKVGSHLRQTSSSTSVDAKPASPTISFFKRSSTSVNASSSSLGLDAAPPDLAKPAGEVVDRGSATATPSGASTYSKRSSPDDSPPGSPPKSTSKPPSVNKTPSISSVSSKEAVEPEAAGAEHAVTPQARRHTISSSEETIGTIPEESPQSKSPSRSRKSSVRSQAGSMSKAMFNRELNNSSASTSSAAGSPQDGQHHKRTALTAVQNAAGVAKRWSMNAWQRNQESRSGSPASQEPALDLNKPMGRGRPLPPPGMPLPPPDRKTSTPLAKLRKPVAPPPPQLPERQKSAEGGEHKSDRRPVPAPPLPRRRRVSHDTSQAEAEGEENIMIVAAPEDSEPNSPLHDEVPARAHAPPVADGGTVPEAVGAFGHSSPTHNGPPKLPERPRPVARRQSGSRSTSPGSRRSARREVAHPRSGVTDLLEDEDLSAWIEDAEGEEQASAAASAAATAAPEGNS